MNALKGSIERLGVDAVDLYQIHGPIHLRSIEVVADALAEAVKLGLVKSVGVSNYSIDQMVRMHAALAKHGIQLASNQVEFSLLRRYPETSGLIAKCHELGVAVLAYSPLGMGRLTGKYTAENPPPSGRRFSNYPMTELNPLLTVIERIAKEHDVPMSAGKCANALPGNVQQCAHACETRQHVELVLCHIPNSFHWCSFFDSRSELHNCKGHHSSGRSQKP